MRSILWTALALAFAAGAGANEVTVQNDSLANDSSGTIQAGFVAGEKAAAWLTSPVTVTGPPDSCCSKVTTP